ncbi:hypothetical protein ACSLBF_18665 (plasmid) [Pseudoalteromonas sp. T1lg65]|uniref:hypothetical protein n=1 Tax=Pseudoalteromonas sp. T1lg65 TaxID=2077101 RepID=UPI003F799CF9
MKPSSLILLFSIVLASIFAVLHYSSANLLYALFLLIMLIAFTSVKGQENLKQITIWIFLVTAIEYAGFGLLTSLYETGTPSYITNACIMTLHLAIDISTLLFIKYRVRVSLKFINFFGVKDWRSIYPTFADYIIYGICLAFIAVDLAALAEHVIVYMDKFFGVAPEVAQQFKNWDLVYNSYPIIKSLLYSSMIATIVATAIAEYSKRMPEVDDEQVAE